MIYVVSASKITTSNEIAYKRKEVLKAFSTKEKAEEYISKLPYLPTLDSISAHIDCLVNEDDTSITDDFLTAFFVQFLTQNICVAEVRELLFDIIKDGTCSNIDWESIKEVIQKAVSNKSFPTMQQILERLGISPYSIEEAELS